MRFLRTLVAVLLVACALQGLRAATMHSALKAVPRADTWWKERAKLLDDRLDQTPDTEILFIGDSITQGWESTGKDVWATHYAKYNAINLGIGGDRTQHVLWRLDNAPLGKVKPKVAVVMIGTNNSNGDDHTSSQIVEGVADIVKTLRRRLPQTKILLLAIFPRNENFSTQRGKIAQINQVLAKLGDDPMVTFLDIGHRFLTVEGLIAVEIMPDYLHLSPEGYQLWAEAMEPTLSKLLEPPQTTQLDPTGTWIWRTLGPDGLPMESPLILARQGNQITGTFSADGDRQLPIESGTLTGNTLSLVVRRTRPQGGEMIYRMTGLLTSDRIQGRVITEADGGTQTQDWTARRR